MGKGVQGVILGQTELIAGDKKGARCAQGEIAAPVSQGASANGGRGVVSRPGAHPHRFRQSQCPGRLRPQGAGDLPAFPEHRKLLCTNPADPQHFGRPLLMGGIQQERAGRVGIVCTVHARHAIGQKVFG